MIVRSGFADSHKGCPYSQFFNTLDTGAKILSRFLPEGNERNFIILLLLLTLVKGFLFAAIVPKWQAPDEPFYFKYTKILVEERRVPTISETPAMGHPPLFPVISIVPYVLTRPLGNTAQVFSIRLLSVLFSIIVVWLGFKTAATIFPENKFVQLLVPALLAFSPQYSFISSSINSDSLLILIFSLTLYQLVLIINSSLTWERFTFLLITLLVGIFSKERFLVILPPLILVIIYEFYKSIRTKLPKFLRQNTLPVLAIVSLCLFFILRWWGKFNFSMVINEKLRSVVPYYTPSPLKELFFSRNFPGRTFEGFWGNFGWWQYIPLRQEIYQTIKLVMLLSLIGLIIWAGKIVWHLVSRRKAQQTVATEPLIKEGKALGEQLFTLAIFLFVIYLALYAAAAYDLTTGGGHGRYILIVMVPLFSFLSLGLGNLFPKAVQQRAFSILFVSLFALNAISLFYTILPWYYQ